MDDDILTAADCERILAEVSPRSRVLIQMRFALLMSYEDIGKELGLSFDKVKSSMQVAMVETVTASKRLATTHSRPDA